MNHDQLNSYRARYAELASEYLKLDKPDDDMMRELNVLWDMIQPPLKSLRELRETDQTR